MGGRGAGSVHAWRGSDRSGIVARGQAGVSRRRPTDPPRRTLAGGRAKK